MDEHEALKEQIRSSNRYKQLVTLRDHIWGLSAKLEFSQYVDLRRRVDDRISEFESPECENVQIKMIFPDNKTAFLDIRECRIALGKGGSLPKYIFEKYDGAEDIEIIPIVVSEYESGSSSPLNSTKGHSLSASFNPKLGILQNRIENVIKLATFMNETYSVVIPKISTDLAEIVQKLEDLYRRVANDEYELRD